MYDLCVILLVCYTRPIILTFDHIVLIIFWHDVELVQVDSGEGVYYMRAGVRVYVVSSEHGGWATIRGPWLHETHQCPAWGKENKQILWVYRNPLNRSAVTKNYIVLLYENTRGDIGEKLLKLYSIQIYNLESHHYKLMVNVNRLNA